MLYPVVNLSASKLIPRRVVLGLSKGVSQLEKGGKEVTRKPKEMVRRGQETCSRGILEGYSHAISLSNGAGVCTVRAVR